jgi:hypothetical protein
MVQDWELQKDGNWKFLRGPGLVRPSTIVIGGFTAVYNEKPCGLAWDELRPQLGAQWAMGCVERAHQAAKATEEGVPAYDPNA